jgi:hypothetical protein
MAAPFTVAVRKDEGGVGEVEEVLYVGLMHWFLIKLLITDY